MSVETIIWLILFAALALGTPIFPSLGLATLVVLTQTNIPLRMIPLDLIKVMEMFPLIAVPCFIFAGAIMDRGGIASQIVETASIFMGRFRGGLAIVTIAGCMFFAAIVGSGPATVAAMGALMIPSMIRRGYSREYAAGVAASGGTLGIIIPPSNPMIVYGVVGNVSIATLFMAGFLPGFIVGGSLILTSYLIARKGGFKGSEEKYSCGEIARKVGRNVWALATPFIILGGIYGGIFTPVEASVIAVAYSLFVATVVNRSLTMRDIIDSIKMTNVTSATVIVVVGVSLLFGRFLSMYQVPTKLALLLTSISNDPFTVLMLIIAVLLFLGMFMETLSTIVILTPVLLPVVKQLGVDPVHFGIIFVLTNEVAFLSPPLGVNLFVAMKLSNLSLERVARGSMPFLLVIIACTVLMTRFPEITLLLPRLFMGYSGG